MTEKNCDNTPPNVVNDSGQLAAVNDDVDNLFNQGDDLYNLYNQEREVADGLINAANKIALIADMRTHDPVVSGTTATFQGSDQVRVVEPEYRLPRKSDRTMTSANSEAKTFHCTNTVKSVLINDFMEIPAYLTKDNPSFAALLRAGLSSDTTETNQEEDWEQVIMFMHHIAYNEILHLLWSAYIRSDVGLLREQHSRSEMAVRIWPAAVRSMVKDSLGESVHEHDACLAWVRKRLVELEKSIQRCRISLNGLSDRLPGYWSDIRQAIERFIEENLASLCSEVEHKIQLLHYDYDERLLELQYLQHHPTESQIQLANRQCTIREQYEMVAGEVRLLERRSIHNTSASPVGMASTSRVQLFDSINDLAVRRQLHVQHQLVTEQAQADTLQVYISSATTQMGHYERENNDEIKAMWQAQHTLPENEKLTGPMIDLIEQRVKVVCERVQCIYHFKAQTSLA